MQGGHSFSHAVDVSHVAPALFGEAGEVLRRDGGTSRLDNFVCSATPSPALAKRGHSRMTRVAIIPALTTARSNVTTQSNTLMVRRVCSPRLSGPDVG